MIHLLARTCGRLVLRLRMWYGYIPNVEWFRTQLSREVAVDRARAHAAIAEMERCLILHNADGSCRRLRAVR